MKSIQNCSVALELYYSKPELANKDIKVLFGNLGSNTLTRLKNMAKVVQVEKNIKTLGMYTVNTKCAYVAWGIDIDELEKNLIKLRKLKLLKEE